MGAFSQCPSCGEKLEETDRYCRCCGQANKSIRGKITGLIGDFFKDYVAFDSKLVATLTPLITKPGFLSLEFV